MGRLCLFYSSALGISNITFRRSIRTLSIGLGVLSAIFSHSKTAFTITVLSSLDIFLMIYVISLIIMSNFIFFLTSFFYRVLR